MSDLKHTRFDEFIVLQRGFDLPRKQMTDGPYPVVGSTSIIGYHNRYKVNPPGVVTGRSGSLGFVQYICDKYWPHNTSLWVKDFKGNFPRYVYYHLLTLDLKRFNSGVGVPTLNRNDLDTLEIAIPPLSTQHKIAAILSAYDDLTENNLRRIKILEEMAQLIYREWFVNFRFPGHEKVRIVESEMGSIPEGWEIKKIKEVIKRLKTGNTYTMNDVEEIGEVIVVDQSRNEYLGFHNNEADHKASPDKPIIIFGDHTCKMQLMVEPFSVGPNVVPFVAVDNLSIYYVFFLVKDLVSTQEYKRHWTELSNKLVPVSLPSMTKQFANLVIPIFEDIEILRKENMNLCRTRNLLLPKLISGELDVSELGIDIGEEPE